MNYQEQIAAVNEYEAAKKFREEEFIPAGKSPFCTPEMRNRMRMLDEQYRNHIRRNKANTVSASTYMALGSLWVKHIRNKEQEAQKEKEKADKALQLLESVQNESATLSPGTAQTIACMSNALVRFIAGASFTGQPASMADVVMTPEEFIRGVQYHLPLTRVPHITAR